MNPLKHFVKDRYSQDYHTFHAYSSPKKTKECTSCGKQINKTWPGPLCEDCQDRKEGVLI